MARIEALRTRGPRAVTKDGKSNLAQLGRIAVHTPYDNASEATGARLERGQIANAAFVQPTSVVDHQDIARFALLHGFQKHIDASEMGSGQYRSHKPLTRHHGPNPRGRDPERDVQPQCRIGNKRRGKVTEKLSERLFFHGRTIDEMQPDFKRRA